ncbi:hypothetical protein LCGC14_2446490, partial [marine sediment metagenome]
MAKAKCVEYDKTGKCVKFRLEHGEMVGYIPKEARLCNPKGAEEAEKLIRAGKVRIDVR